MTPKVVQHDDVSTVQRMPNGAEAIQTPLKEDCLNVVGENHKESGARRVDEKNYTVSHIGLSNYWQEHEFRERSLTEEEKKEKMTKKSSYVDKRKMADPFKLRFLHWIKLIEENAAEIAKFSPLNWKIYFIKKLINQIDLIQTLWSHLQLLKLNVFDAEFEKNEKEKFLDLEEYVKNIAVTWESLYKRNYNLAIFYGFNRSIKPEQLKFDWASGGKVVTTHNSEESYKASINALLDALVKKGLINSRDSTKTEEEFNKERSYAMHYVANKRYLEKDVWKIGQDHVDDIKELPRTYNLVTRDEFNAHFNKWLEAENMRRDVSVDIPQLI